MSCKYIWFSLPKQIKKTIEPYNDLLSKEAKNILWFNLPKKLNLLYSELYQIKSACTNITPETFIWFDLPNKLEALCSLANCEIVYNFDVEFDAKTMLEDIIDKDSFISFLENIITVPFEVNDFTLTTEGVKCNLITEEDEFDFSGRFVTKVRALNIPSMISLFLQNNNLTEFNPELPQGIENLDLGSNSITHLSYIEKLSSLKYLNLNENQVAKIENISNLINLQQLSLSFNNITKIENLDSLVNITDLYLSANQILVIENINTLINLQTLHLNGNQINEINPIDNLININVLDLQNNLLDTTQFNILDSWAQLTADNGEINTEDNTDPFSISDTFATLDAKGWTIT